MARLVVRTRVQQILSISIRVRRLARVRLWWTEDLEHLSKLRKSLHLLLSQGNVAIAALARLG